MEVNLWCEQIYPKGLQLESVYTLSLVCKYDFCHVFVRRVPLCYAKVIHPTCTSIIIAKLLITREQVAFK